MNGLNASELLLMQMMARHADQRPAWDALVATGQHLNVAATVFLLDVGLSAAHLQAEHSVEHSVESFAQHTLARLLRLLNRRTEREQVLLRGQVRGRIAWPATYKARYDQGYDPDRFVCQQSRFAFDTPENQLLKFLVSRLAACLRLVPQAIRAGISYYTASHRLHPRPTESALSNITIAVHNAQRCGALHHVSLLESIPAEHLARVAAADMPEYRLVAVVCQRYLAAHLTASHMQAEVYARARRVLPLPYLAPTTTWDTLTEPDALWLRWAADVLQTAAGQR